MESSGGDKADPRLDERSNVFLSAILHGASASFPVRIRNFSATGAMVDGTDLPAEGSRVNLQRGRLEANAEIAWQSGNFRGLRFDSPIDVGIWMKGSANAGQTRVDKAMAALRDGAPMPLSVLEEQGESSVEELIEELLRICERIATSPSLTVELGEEILRIEAIGLSLRKLNVGS